MNRYREFVSKLASENSEKTFLNTDKDHGIVVLAQIFDKSLSEIRIFAGTLCGEVGDAPEYIEALSNFIERNGILRILLNNYQIEQAKNSNLFKRLAYYISDHKDIIIKETTAKPYFASDIEKKPLHFTIGDKQSYRIETDIEKKTAECNFNNPELAKIYADFFDELFGQSNQVIDVNQIFGM